MHTQLIDALNARGLVGKVAPIAHLTDLRRTMQALIDDGLLADELARIYFDAFTYDPPESVRHPRSLIVVAVADRHVRFTFARNGIHLRVPVPPTYVHAKRTDRMIESCLAEILEPCGYSAVPTTLPKKTLAVRSGLGAYGRNNITYVDGLGSYHRLAVFVSDLPPETDTWRDSTLMDACEGCDACLHACPSEAIPTDRFLLRAERCIVFHNEKPASESFPDWMDRSWHHCLVGCLHCQANCPANPDPSISTVDAAEFSHEETSLLLAATPIERMPATIAAKLREWDLDHWLDVLPRNLEVLFAEAGGTRPS